MGVIKFWLIRFFVIVSKNSDFPKFNWDLWLNYMAYNFDTNTSWWVWFSGFQKGVILPCSSNCFWFISIFVTVTVSQEFRFWPTVSARKSSNFKWKFWLNYMAYKFDTNTSRLLWFSGFQKGATLTCSSKGC